MEKRIYIKFNRTDDEFAGALGDRVMMRLPLDSYLFLMYTADKSKTIAKIKFLWDGGDADRYSSDIQLFYNKCIKEGKSFWFKAQVNEYEIYLASDVTIDYDSIEYNNDFDLDNPKTYTSFIVTGDIENISEAQLDLID